MIRNFILWIGVNRPIIYGVIILIALVLVIRNLFLQNKIRKWAIQRSKTNKEQAKKVLQYSVELQDLDENGHKKKVKNE
jgi:uncharacterized membrane protein